MLPALLLAATLVVVGLLIAVLVRLGARFEGLKAELERLRVVQRDMSSDVRARLDEGARTWESVEAEMRPRLAQLEPSVADLSAALEENLPALSEARSRLEDVEGRVSATEARVYTALETGAQEGEERFERIEAAVRTVRDAADERLADLAARVHALEAATEDGRGTPEAREDEEPAALEPVGAAAGSPEMRQGHEKPRQARGGRWALVMLLLAAGAVIALVAQFR